MDYSKRGSEYISSQLNAKELRYRLYNSLNEVITSYNK